MQRQTFCLSFQISWEAAKPSTLTASAAVEVGGGLAPPEDFFEEQIDRRLAGSSA